MVSAGKDMRAEAEEYTLLAAVAKTSRNVWSSDL
jgi:hypothetical protein